MNRFKLFIENFLIYGLGGVMGKMIPFFMLPVITRLIPNSYYMGLSDMSNTLLSFSQAFAVMGMYDAMFRMFFEKEEQIYKKEVCSSAVAFIGFSSLLVFLFLFTFKEQIAESFFADSSLIPLVFVTAVGVLAGATNNIVAAPTRMQNKRRIFLATNVITPLISYGIAIYLLRKGNYIYALPLGSVIAAIATEVIFIFLNYKWFSLKFVRWNLIKSMLCIGIPLLPNFLIYWVFNSCDRIMISQFLGMEHTGLYAVGSKFGHISQLIYSAFAGGWQYFAFSTMRDEDQVELTSRVFEYLGCLAFSATILVSFCSDFFFAFLFGEEYQAAAVTVPYLFMAPLAQMLFQVAANQFLVIKKTMPSSMILFAGAIGNVGLNAILIPRIGIEGAAIATLVGFSLSTLICACILTKMRLFQVSSRCKWVAFLFVLYMLLWRIFNHRMAWISILAGSFVLLLYLIFYKKDLESVKVLIHKKENYDS